ncbi:MAG: TonB-dependent receptor [Polyangiaceae bacterium]|nr:TonB-dependent receptor [Polyangiaceae bacterium]
MVTEAVSLGHGWGPLAEGVFAQEEPARPKPVVTGTRTEEPKATSIVDVEVVERERIVLEGATDVGDSLEHVVGIYDLRPFAFFVDGIDLRRVLLLEDGERMLLDDPVDLPITDTDRIEVVRGPLGSPWGNGALGAAINLISEPPVPDGWSGNARLEGRYRWGALITRNIGLRGGDLWAAFDATVHAADSVHPTEEGPVSVPSLKQQSFVFRAGMRVSKKFRADSRFRYARVVEKARQSEPDPDGMPIIDVTEESHRISARFRGIFELGRGHDLTMSASTQWIIGSDELDVRDSGIRQSASTLHTLHAIETVGSFGRGAPLSTVVGLRAEVERFARDIELRDLPASESSALLGNVDPSLVATGAGFAELRGDPLKSLSWLAGIRVEGSNRFGPFVAPRGAVAVRPLSWLNFRFEGGRGFRSPTPVELGLDVESSRAGRVIGSETLEPESAWTINGSAEARPVRPLLLRARGYGHWIEDAIELVGYPTFPAPTFRYENIARARIAGIDAEISYDLGAKLQTSVGYSFLHARDVDSDEPLPGRPPHGFWASFRGVLPLEISFVTKLRYVASPETLGAQSIETPSYAIFDARIGRPIWPDSEIYVGGLNLNGVEADPTLPGDLRPREGRTVYIGFRFAYPVGPG